MKSLDAYALSRKYTEDTAIQFGAVKGAPCQLAGSRKDADGNTVLTFSWKNDSGTVKTQDVTVTKGVNGTDGVDGLSITGVAIVDSKLVCTLSDGSTITTEEEFPSGTLKDKITVSNPVGSATSGKVYAAGTSFEALLRDILIKEEAPTATLSFTPSKVLYDKITETLSSLQIKTVVGRKTYDIASIKIYVDDTLVKTITDSVSTGGTFNYTHTFTPAVTADTVIKVVVADVKGMQTTKTQTFKFVSKTYYGFVAPEIGEPTEAQIKALQNNTLKDVKGFVYKNISFDYNKVVYAYPKSFGDLTSIKDKVNNFTYFPGSFTKTVVSVDSIDYNVYTQNDASQSVGLELTFE